jgi:hypothetical protein
MKNLEPTIRVVLTLFAAILGYGLKRILDNADAIGGIYGVNGWILFLITLSLSIRFFTGSANHTSARFLQTSKAITDKDAWEFIVDICILIMSGVLLSAVCYSESPAEYLLLSIAFLTLAIIWGLIERYIWKVDKWFFWFKIDFLLVILYVIILCIEYYGILRPDYRIFNFEWPWLVLLVFSLASIVVDIRSQIKVLQSEKSS